MRKIHVTLLKQGPLSPKEAIVLCKLCEGYSRKEIANLVFRSLGTVSCQIESIAYKLKCHSAAEIVATAVAVHLVSIKIDQTHSLFAQCLCAILAFNISAAHIDLRRAPRSPRPVRSQRTSLRLSRTQNRFF